MKPGYKQTEVGVIPEDWEVKRLGEIGDSLIGLTYSPSDVRSHGTLVLRSSNVQNDALSFEDNVFVEAEIPQRIMVQPDDILICVRNGSRDLIGKSARIDERAIGMTFGAFMAVFRSPNGRFIHFLFQSNILKRQINEHLGATINQITNKSLNSFKIPFPLPSTEQRAIATALSDVDALLAALDRLIAKKRDLKQAAMQQLLTGQTRLPGFTGKWETKRLGDLAMLKNGYAFKSETYTSLGTFKVITIANVQDGFMAADACNTIASAPPDLQPHQRLRIGEILISMTGNVGRVCRVDEDHCLLNQRVGKLVPIDVVESLLFVMLGQPSFISAMTGVAKGGAQPNLSASDITEHTFNIPKDTAEQAAIATVLCDMDAELAALEQRRDKTRALKQGMMQELLTGRTRLI